MANFDLSTPQQKVSTPLVAQHEGHEGTWGGVYRFVQIYFWHWLHRTGNIISNYSLQSKQSCAAADASHSHMLIKWLALLQPATVSMHPSLPLQNRVAAGRPCLRAQIPRRGSRSAAFRVTHCAAFRVTQRCIPLGLLKTHSCHALAGSHSVDSPSSLEAINGFLWQQSLNSRPAFLSGAPHPHTTAKEEVWHCKTLNLTSSFGC